MSTLKICTHDMTYWLTDISEVHELSSFPVPGAVLDGTEDIIQAARENGYQQWPSCFTVVDFKGHGPQAVGNVLAITRANGIEWWIVPNRACFLMSDTGQTIDRI